ncbi:YceI family protein [Labrenzia sp. DG1229]|uniref:YceI family protein n=1 Tax=Labrenzia sp. DG1229 TaxID=681847 RepID=UPI00048A7231|nr:YceI family protein [Labrenzia sp. DG1229]
MIRLAPISIAAILLTAPAAVATTYKTDQGHTEVQFSWSHAGVSTQSGEFTTVDGTLDIDPENAEDASLNVTIKTDSLATGFKPLDDHLSSADFLEVETYPEITFVSTAVEKTGEDTAKVTGDLTLHGTTKPVTLDTKLTHIGPHPVGSSLDYYKGEWIAFEASTTIDHMEFGVGPFSTGPITIQIITEMKAE